MTAGLDVPKEDPAVIVAAIFDGLEAGDFEPSPIRPAAT